MTPIREQNRRLAITGVRKCEVCRKPMPLDGDHFYAFTSASGTYYAYACIRCWRDRENAKARRRKAERFAAIISAKEMP